MKQHTEMKALAQRGFTLIELLVVVAIIGLLAAIVITSVGTARNKGAGLSSQGTIELSTLTVRVIRKQQ
jgi:prepilin-type N-terminal cleavage/methylation domain-containing protein